MKKKICLITSGQPSINPRLVKEADALAEAGYEVIVVAVFYTAWADKADKDLCADKKWKLFFTGGSPTNKKFLYFLTRIRHRIAKELFKLGSHEVTLNAAVIRTTPDLIKQAKKIKADLYIAHNLGALPAAVIAAQENKAKAGFDAEDFHSGEQSSDHQRTLIAELLERKYLPLCDYITAASGPIAQAYAQKYAIPEPAAILNVFPLRFLQEQQGEPLNAGLSLYWFSQVIGLDRGLQDVLLAMGKVKKEVHLYLQGKVTAECRSQLMAIALENGIPEERIHFLPPCLPDDLFKVAAQFDIGLALEQRQPLNRDLCLTNKIFTYLLAGLSVIATETQGQKFIIGSIGRGGWMFKAGDIQALAARIEFLYGNREELKNSKLEVLKQARERYNWDIESNKFLDVIRKVLAK